VEFQAGAPVGVVSAEAHEQLQVTECPEAELVKARIPDALRATGVMFTSVAPQRLDSSTAASMSLRPTPFPRQCRSTTTGSRLQR
jgi:hypothetical protein